MPPPDLPNLPETSGLLDVYGGYRKIMASLAVHEPAVFRRILAAAEAEAARIGQRQPNGAVVSAASIMVSQLVGLIRGRYDDDGHGTAGPQPASR